MYYTGILSDVLYMRGRKETMIHLHEKKDLVRVLIGHYTILPLTY
jgi:hypothetical protein